MCRGEQAASAPCVATIRPKANKLMGTRDSCGFQTVFFANPEGEIIRRLAFLLRGRQHVRLYAGV